MSVRIDPNLPLPAQLKLIREDAGKSLMEIAGHTGLSRLTVSAAEGKSDARLSTIAALLNVLGYTLLPVPKTMVNEVAAFINNGGKQVSLPSGIEAPMGIAQRAFLEGDEDLAADPSPQAGKN